MRKSFSLDDLWDHYDNSNVANNCDEHVKIPFKNYFGSANIIPFNSIGSRYRREYLGFDISFFYLEVLFLV